MRTIRAIMLCAVALTISACGPNIAFRATSTAVVGALAAGAPGAVVGAALGSSIEVR